MLQPLNPFVFGGGGQILWCEEHSLSYFIFFIFFIKKKKKKKKEKRAHKQKKGSFPLLDEKYIIRT